jgi:CheY-like chemotaxis protein
MARIRLMHWNATEAAPRVELLRKAGHEVQYEEKAAPAAIRAGAPEAVVIDLTRMPSHGREVAVWIRGTKATRHIPIVFAGGEAEKVDRIRQIIPDAAYTEWAGIKGALKKALANPPATTVVPPQMMTRYGDRTVAQKLGIKTGDAITAIDPPRNFPDLLGSLPEDVEFGENERKPGRVILWFVHDAATYQAFIGKRGGMARQSKLWVLWPKGERGKRMGITQVLVRQAALDAGLVDYKICAVDDKWSAMLFAAGKNG